MDAYSILGVARNSTLAEVKKAYRKMANKCHPDKETGDEEKFKKINQAYEDIKSGKANKPVNQRQYNFRTGSDIYDFFQQQGNVQRTTQTIRISANISIANAVTGGMQVLEVPLVPGQHPQYINVEIPAGLMDGETIRYPKILLHKIDVYVSFRLIPDKVWTINRLDLIKTEAVDFWDLILGTTREIKTITNEVIKITIPAMTKPGTNLKLTKKGIRSRQNYLIQGDMYVKIQCMLPDVIPNELLSIIKDIKAK